MTATRALVWRLAAGAGSLALLLPLGLLLLSVAFAPTSNWIVRAALLGFCLLAIARPDAAVLVTTALAGFGIILSHLAGMPELRAIEVLVVASIAGFGVRSLATPIPFRAALRDSLSVPILGLAVCAAASAAVWQRVYQLQLGSFPGYVEALARLVTRDYFVAPGDFAMLATMAVVLEGLALYVVVRSLCRMDLGFFDTALRMLVVGGAGLALMSVVRLAEILLRNPGAIQMMRDTSVGLRISPQIPDYIAAGSYFGLCWLAAIGLALAYSGKRWTWLAIGVPLIAGLYLTGSRSVIGAAVVGLLIPGGIALRRKTTTTALRGIVAFAAFIVVIMVASYSWMSGRDVAGELARQSLTVRAELLRAGSRVIATRPVFGVGLDRFYLVAGEFASPELRALWQGRMNPHNDFLRFGAELGLVGLALFLWILGDAGTRILRDLGATRDAKAAGLAGGLVAFLVTSLFSNPLMVREVSYVFWIALGLAVGHSAQMAAVGRDDKAFQPATGVRRTGWRVAIGVALTIALVASVPFRARQEIATIDPARASYGLYDWATDANGTRYRWSAERATLFVDGRASFVEIPFSSLAPAGGPQQVEIRVDGRLADRIEVGRNWLRHRTPLPPTSSATPHRIDIIVSPAWMQTDLEPGSAESRVVGVRVGEISVMTGGPRR